MANISKKLNIGELDFEQIKSNLIAFMSAQDEFTDYDFTGSGLNVLLEILAYNTHYNVMYQNLAINESFLDSASKRNSVVSRANELGYLAKSASAAKARINLFVTAPTSSPISLSLPRFTPFSTVIDNETYTFYTIAEHTTIALDNSYTFNDVDIYQGEPLTFTYYAGDGTRFYIPNIDCDIATLKITVKESISAMNVEVFNRAESIINIDSNSKIYFIKEIEDNLYEIIFGNGTFGKALESGNIVTLEYLVSSKGAVNGAKSFGYQGSPLLGGVVTLNTVLPAYGGGETESIEEIKYNAPMYYAAQNRAITPDDYKVLLKKYYTDISSINVWRGEDNVPPVYGKVFICIKPLTENILTFSQKEYIKEEIIRGKNNVGIFPELVDANFINIKVTSTVYFDAAATTRTSNDIAALVEDTIRNYSVNNLARFDGAFRYSRFINTIDQTDDSITNNITTIKLHRPVDVMYGVPATYKIDLRNPIYKSFTPENSINTTAFYIMGSNDRYYLDDDGIGNIRLYTLPSTLIKNVVNPTIGTIDYDTGVLFVNELNINLIDGDDWEIIAAPKSNDVISSANNIVQIPDDMISVSVLIDPISAGAKEYVWAESR